MHSYRYRPNDNYLYEATWDDLLFLAKKWKSELTLYTYDLKYLEQQVDASFETLLIYEDPIELRELKRDIEIYIVQCSILLKRVPSIINQLTFATKEPDVYNSTNFRKELELFEDDYSMYIESVKVLRLIVLLKLKNISQKVKPEYYWKMN